MTPRLAALLKALLVQLDEQAKEAGGDEHQLDEVAEMAWRILRGSVSPGVWERWFAPLEPLGLELTGDGELRLQLGGPADVVNWVEAHFDELLRAAVRVARGRIAGKPSKVTVRYSATRPSIYPRFHVRALGRVTRPAARRAPASRRPRVRRRARAPGRPGREDDPDPHDLAPETAHVVVLRDLVPSTVRTPS
jgi:hypothetical protein